MKRIDIDFNNVDSIIDGLSHIYGVSKDSISQFANNYTDQVELLSAFFEKSKIYPDTHPLDNVYLKCKVIGKYPDKSMLEADGLLPVIELLRRGDSFLSQFLKKYGISIDVENKTFKLDTRTVQIEELSNLGVKLYHDKGEIEAFYCADIETMKGYSCVKDYPEILLTIDEFVEEKFKKDFLLGEQWSKISTGFDVLSFYAKLDNTTYISGYSDDWLDASPYDEFYENEYPYTDSYPKLLFMNLWLLKHGFDRIQGEMYNDLCLGIKNTVRIPYEEIRIEHYDI